MLTKRNSVRMITVCGGQNTTLQEAVNKDWHHVVFAVLTLVTMKNIVLWKMTPCGLVANITIGAFTLLAACLAYSLTLKMEAVRSSKTSTNVYQTTRRLFAESCAVMTFMPTYCTYLQQ
jgi:hypothetical protein